MLENWGLRKKQLHTMYSEIDDQELDVFVRTILALLPNSGEVMIRGAPCGRGVRIQRSSLRESIQRVDPPQEEGAGSVYE